MKLLNIITQLYRRNPLLSVVGWFHMGLLVIFLLLIPFDSRLITGINPWIKPSKFAISITIFSWTMAWILFYFTNRPKGVKIYSILFALTMLVEMAIITVQAARGTNSHFNVFSSPLNGMLFALMGVFITINLIVTIILLIDFFRLPTSLAKPMLWAIRLGLFTMILASFEGFAMTSMLSHTVGATDGGPGLLVVNWSTIAGDLRVAHFLGIHGLQVFPLFAFMLTKAIKELPTRAKTSMVISFAILYMLLMNFTLWQALNKLPLIRIHNATEVSAQK